MDTKKFATRSEIKECKHPEYKDRHIIGLDMGYSGAKAFHENGYFIFPNICQKMDGEIFGDLSKNDLIYEDLTSGEKYCVGLMASKSLSTDGTVAEDELLSRNHYNHPDFLIKFRTAIGLARWNIPDDEDLFIQTGLPPAYMSDEIYLRNAIQKNHDFAITSGKERREFHLNIKADQIDIMYQPMGTFYSSVTDASGNLTGNLKTFRNSNIMVFDGGFKTLDKFVVQGKQIKLKDSDATLGMQRILEETRTLLLTDLKSKGYNTSISIPAMQLCLKTGCIKVNDMINLEIKEFPIDEYLEKGNKIVRETAFESIKDYVFTTNYLILTGGTGAAWFDYFKERLEKVSTLKLIPGDYNSTLPFYYSNARGYYMYRLNQFKLAK